MESRALTELHVSLQVWQVQHHVMSLHLRVVRRLKQFAKDGVAGDGNGHVLAPDSVGRRQSRGDQRRIPRIYNASADLRSLSQLALCTTLTSISLSLLTRVLASSSESFLATKMPEML
jgi:hypothetical protein